MNDVLRHWRKWHREQLNEALAGPHGAVVKPIMDFLGQLTPEKMPALLKFMRAQDWRLVDADVRLVVLHELNAAITRLREREGKPPIDDALPGEAPTLFLIVRELLSCTAGNPAGEFRHNRRTG